MFTCRHLCENSALQSAPGAAGTHQSSMFLRPCGTPSRWQQTNQRCPDFPPGQSRAVVSSASSGFPMESVVDLVGVEVPPGGHRCPCKGIFQLPSEKCQKLQFGLFTRTTVKDPPSKQGEGAQSLRPEAVLFFQGAVGALPSGRDPSVSLNGGCGLPSAVPCLTNQLVSRSQPGA